MFVVATNLNGTPRSSYAWQRQRGCSGLLHVCVAEALPIGVSSRSLFGHGILVSLQDMHGQVLDG